jgi:fructose-1-phosphate kinase PfkB-like protein
MTRTVTVTLNPAVDLGCPAELVRPTHKIRTLDEHIDPGGGGINVARVLHALRADVLAVTAAGGVTGALIEELLSESGVAHLTMRCDGRSRISSRCSIAPRKKNTGSCLWAPSTSRTTGPRSCHCWINPVRVARRQWQPGAWHAA